MPLARVSCIALALVGCAWFVLGIRQAHDTDSATAIVSGQDVLSASQAARAASLLRTAGTLNPDSQVEMLRGQLALSENDRPRAKRIFEDIVSREPMNVTAWLWLLKGNFTDPRVIRLALANVARLDPRDTQATPARPRKG